VDAAGKTGFMARLNRVARFLRLPPNKQGRDLVVGDLHGHRELLEQQLQAFGFDPSRDRVLSVGDLIDRGPDSFGTLRLIEEPWFHAVLGNHELMLLNFLGFYSSRVHTARSYAAGGGQWINRAYGKHRKTLLRLADRLASLPLSLHVAGNAPFCVMHGDLHPIGSAALMSSGDETICVHKAETTTMSRSNLGAASKSALLSLRFAQHDVQLTESPMAEMPLTYVGHSPLRNITVHNSYVYIDQGVCLRQSKQSCEARPPTVLDHAAFASWLDGATMALARVAHFEPPRSARFALTDERMAISGID
jgi:serine/threonine protein phosphatase 1